MTTDPEQFTCANCTKTLPVEHRSDIDSATRKFTFFSMNQILPTGNKGTEVCKRCARQVWIWIAFVIVLVVISPYLARLRDGA